MLNENVHPSTIGGIKRYAKQLKKTQSLPYHKALDIAARSASFENFSHAHNQLHKSNLIQSVHKLFFATYWYDEKKRASGREVLEIELSKPLLKIATKTEIGRKHNSLGKFRLASIDLLVSDSLFYSQEEARNSICYAVRVLRFMEITGLKPSGNYKAAYPNRNHNNKLPKTDHATYWQDPNKGQFIIIDEPYLDPTVNGERANWAKEHNWHLRASTWAGMYYPGMTSLFVATDASKGYDFDGLMKKIDNIPYPLTLDKWSGMSFIGHDTFYSELTKTAQDRKRAVAKGTIFRFPSKKTVPMRNWNAPNNVRRPNSIMSVESHLLAANLIKAIEQSTAKPSEVNTRLSSIRSNLESWFLSEHNKEKEVQCNVYYSVEKNVNDPVVFRAQSSKSVLNMLKELKILLLDSYVDCEPLRRLVNKLDTSIKLSSTKI